MIRQWYIFPVKFPQSAAYLFAFQGTYHNIMKNSLFFLKGIRYMFPYQHHCNLNDVTILICRLLQSSKYAHETWKLANTGGGKWRTLPKKGSGKLTFRVQDTASCLLICISQLAWVEICWYYGTGYCDKMASGGMVLIKYLLFFFNFIFWVSVMNLLVSWLCSWITKVLYFTLFCIYFIFASATCGLLVALYLDKLEKHHAFHF